MLETYGGSVEHAEALGVNKVGVLDVVEAHPCLVGQEHGVLTEDHDASDAEEDDSDERSEAAARAAR